MQSFSDVIQFGNAWLFIPSAIVLGALHGLEPGHSKTMMAAFIVAIRGTTFQAVLLGLSATISHTAIVWIIALGGQYLGRELSAETAEPYLQLGSAVIIAGIAIWMLSRIAIQNGGQKPANHHHPHSHVGHSPSHGRHHDQDLTLPSADESAHEREHSEGIRRHFAGRDVTTAQIILFGLTGGLIPCPAAITVLLLCLQFKEISLGIVLVLCFSVGLAITLIAVGVIAAISVRHARQRWPGLQAIARRAPYASAALVLAVGIYMGVHGWLGLT